ncbi:MAG: sodium:solute symporter family transporter [Rubripirellula sp.]
MISGTNTALLTFLFYTIAVFLLAILSNRVAKGKEFVGEYFLGSRSFGVWAFALTFAATNASGGTFMGFPALIYTHGWSLALWIAGYMALPLVSMAILGKRINQIARQSGALTIPEVLKARFHSERTGLVATSMLIFFMFFYIVAQFKAGGKILTTLLADDPIFQSVVQGAGALVAPIPWVNQADPDYLVCLLVFAVAVIVYVVYGGFRAVVWTDVMQGIVMFVGVVLMLGLTLYQVGGLESATKQIAKMTPPEFGEGVLRLPPQAGVGLPEEDIFIPKGMWVIDGDHVVRVAESTVIAAGNQQTSPTRLLRLTTASEQQRVRDSVAANISLAMELEVEVDKWDGYQYGAGQTGVYLTNPGPSETNSLGFLAIGSAISFFIFWPFAATGQPSNLVRLLSFKDTKTLQYSVVTVSIYYSVIYFSLVVVFCCARVLLPGMEVDPDRTMPDLATHLTRVAGVPWLAGILVAAPFAAVMSSVDSFLLVVSSAVVRDLYQGSINKNASEKKIKKLSYQVTIVVGFLAMCFVLNPPKYLQDLIVFATGGLAACFLVPLVLSLYWRRMTAAAAIAGMLGGTVMHVVLTGWGYYVEQEFRAFEFLGLNPFLWDLVGSVVGCLLAVLFGPPAKEETVLEYFPE